MSTGVPGAGANRRASRQRAAQEGASGPLNGPDNEDRETMVENRIPVILDTDIGGDIDDTWALAMMLRSSELDVKLVVSDTGDTSYRGKIIAKMLETAGRADIPVGIGVPFDSRHDYSQAEWVRGYELADYPGDVLHDGVQAIIDAIMNSPRQVTLVCIGPVPNIARALEREPRIVENARFVGMHGSVRGGHSGSPETIAECNVVNHTRECQKVFSASWDMTITPLDTCGVVVLDGDIYQAVRQCDDPMIRSLMDNYRAWLEAVGRPSADIDRKSSVLYDTVAVYLAFSEELLAMEDLPIRVTDDGYTVIDENAKTMHVATDWKDLTAFKTFLIARLTGIEAR